jgi:adenine-specific DNA methylase
VGIAAGCFIVVESGRGRHACGCAASGAAPVVEQHDAVNADHAIDGAVVSTDPPYYDNVPYADLSDFFYVWLRRSLRVVFPDLFATLASPKAEKLVAFAYRHNGRAGAEAFFLEGMTKAVQRIAQQAHPAFPVSIYYAFKEGESNDEDNWPAPQSGFTIARHNRLLFAGPCCGPAERDGRAPPLPAADD